MSPDVRLGGLDAKYKKYVASLTTSLWRLISASAQRFDHTVFIGEETCDLSACAGEYHAAPMTSKK